jgi:thioesterase domain-containing protein
VVLSTFGSTGVPEGDTNRWPETVWFFPAWVRPLSHSHAIEAQWHRATGAKFESREIPGNHLTMLAPPAVDFLAEAMSKDIRAALACRAQY